jgi:transcriptional regulator of acetoin/glycerol metabolism
MQDNWTERARIDKIIENAEKKSRSGKQIVESWQQIKEIGGAPPTKSKADQFSNKLIELECQRLLIYFFTELIRNLPR